MQFCALEHSRQQAAAAGKSNKMYRRGTSTEETVRVLRNGCVHVVDRHTNETVVKPEAEQHDHHDHRQYVDASQSTSSRTAVLPAGQESHESSPRRQESAGARTVPVDARQHIAPTAFRRRLNCASGGATSELRRAARRAVDQKWRTIGQELRLISEQFKATRRGAPPGPPVPVVDDDDIRTDIKRSQSQARPCGLVALVVVCLVAVASVSASAAAPQIYCN